MPISNNKLRNPDSFIMNEDTVNIAVFNYLTSKGALCEKPLVGKQQGVDVKGKIFGYSIFVESKGSQPNGLVDDTVFTHSQIVSHLARQIHTLMKYADTEDVDKTLFILANPDIQRIRDEVDRVRKSINKLQFICFWIQEDKSVLIECDDKQKVILEELGLL